MQKCVYFQGLKSRTCEVQKAYAFLHFTEYILIEQSVKGWGGVKVHHSMNTFQIKA